jgi:hypothetical protein
LLSLKPENIRIIRLLLGLFLIIILLAEEAFSKVKAFLRRMGAHTPRMPRGD